jgi:hypothetical protein
MQIYFPLGLSQSRSSYLPRVPGETMAHSHPLFRTLFHLSSRNVVCVRVAVQIRQSQGLFHEIADSEIS